LISSKNSFERIALKVLRKRRTSSGVLNFEELVLSVFKRRLKTVFPGYTLHLPLSDLGKPSFSGLFKLSKDVCQNLIFLLLRQSCSLFSFYLRQSVASPLHTSNS